MKTILLTQNKYALVDDEDFEQLNKYKWCAEKNHQVWYATRRIWKNNQKIGSSSGSSSVNGSAGSSSTVSSESGSTTTDVS